MNRYFYVIRDGVKIEARCGTRENAIDLIRMKQEQEKKAHQWLHPEFEILEGSDMETIRYE